jgi:hypothetical protein
VLDVIINNLDDGDHPFHLHGHKPFLVGTGAGQYQGQALGGANPMRRDTFLVPAYTWGAFRVVLDHAGYWARECSLRTDDGCGADALTRAQCTATSPGTWPAAGSCRSSRSPRRRCSRRARSHPRWSATARCARRAWAARTSRRGDPCTRFAEVGGVYDARILEGSVERRNAIIAVRGTRNALCVLDSVWCPRVRFRVKPVYTSLGVYPIAARASARRPPVPTPTPRGAGPRRPRSASCARSRARCTARRRSRTGSSRAGACPSSPRAARTWARRQRRRGRRACGRAGSDPTCRRRARSAARCRPAGRAGRARGRTWKSELPSLRRQMRSAVL